MQAQIELEEVNLETPPEAQEIPVSQRWHLAKRVTFRFVFAYLVLYILPFPLSQLPFTGYLLQKYMQMWNAIIPWVGKHVLRLSYDVPVIISGSGDKTFDYVKVFCLLVLAAMAALVWSLLDRKRGDYRQLDKWLRLYVRFSLASWMIIYGSMKAIPLQMPTPSFGRLLGTYGESSPMGILWTFIGSSPAYTSITGCVELLGGVLLIFSRTALLGAIVSCFAMAHVFILNMCYDVPVKLFSFHLLLMSIFLMVPHLGRLVSVLLLNRRVEPAETVPLFQRKRVNRVAVVLLTVFGLYLIGSNLYNAYQMYWSRGAGATKPPLYGIWTVGEFTADGQTRPPLTTDDSRWQRVLIERPGFLSIQPMSGPRQAYSLQLDSEMKSLTLGKPDDQNWTSTFSIHEAEPESMTWEGEMDGRRLRVKLQRYDESQFLLPNRKFQWVQERPFNR